MNTGSVQSFRVGTLLVIAVVSTCAARPGTSTVAVSDIPLGNSLTARFETAARKACTERAVAPCSLIALDRESITEEIAHYTAVLQIGDGAFDAITLHRIVREHRPGIPDRVDRTFFFLHGSGNQFLYSMLNAHKTDGLGLYLAERNVDVWGLDLRWVRVPRSQTDFAFMQEWNFDLQVRDVRLATRFARHARRVTGQHFGGLNLAGASLGASLVFAVANDEAARPLDDRDVAGLIPMDTIYALPASSTVARKLFCDAEAAQRTNIAHGVFAASGVRGQDIGRFALENPGGMSPLAPPLTNRQLALNNAASFGFPPLAYHMFAVTRNPQGQPNGGRFSDESSIFEFYALVTSYRAVATFVDYFAIGCGDASQHHLAHLGDITVPVLYVGYAGGFGKEGLYTTTLLGSTDVTTLVIRMLSEAEAKDDFGHGDWMSARDTVALFRDPVWQWIAAR